MSHSRVRPVPGRGQQAVAKRHQHRRQPLVLGDQPRGLAHRGDLGVAGLGVAGASAKRRPVHHDRAARSQQPHALDDEVRLVGRVGIDEDQVVGLVSQPGEHLLGPATDQPGPRRPDARLGERLLGEALVLGLDVDRGEHTVVPHAGQQPQGADACAGAHLDDRLRAAELRQHTEEGPDGRGDGACPGLDGAVAGRGHDRVLGDGLFGVVDDRLGAAGLRLARRVIGHARSVERCDAATTATRPRHDAQIRLSSRGLPRLPVGDGNNQVSQGKFSELICQPHHGRER